MPDRSGISPYTASCGGGLILNKDVYNMQPGEALQLTNFDPQLKVGIEELMVLQNIILQLYHKYHHQQNGFN